eukprot:7014413-Prymnesium_polylepis.1
MRSCEYRYGCEWCPRLVNRTRTRPNIPPDARTSVPSGNGGKSPLPHPRMRSDEAPSRRIAPNARFAPPS